VSMIFPYIQLGNPDSTLSVTKFGICAKMIL
jgi:hypothetical protein